MLTAIYDKKEDLFEALINGELQSYIRDYIEQLLDEEVKFDTESEVLEYFDLEYRYQSYDITYENLLDQLDCRDDVVAYRNAILATYRRVIKEYNSSKANKDKRITIRLSAYQLEALELYADNHQMTSSEVLRKYIKSLDEYKQVIRDVIKQVIKKEVN